jgi:DNA-binding CsgD family transcriptional regulator
MLDATRKRNHRADPRSRRGRRRGAGAHPHVTATHAEELASIGLLAARHGDRRCWAALDDALRAARRADAPRLLAFVAVARAEASWLELRSVAVAAETENAYARAIELQDRWLAGELAVWRRRAGIPGEAPAWLHPAHALELAGEFRRAARERGCPYEAALVLGCAPYPDCTREALVELRNLGALVAAAAIEARLSSGHSHARQGVPSQNANPGGLTDRQLEVLRLIALGLRNGEIAERLVVSEKTVHHHVAAIFGKLGVRNRVQAAAEAQRLDIRAPRLIRGED